MDRTNLEKEIGKIDVEKLRNVVFSPGGGFATERNEGIGVYLALPGRMEPNNAMMMMRHVGGWVFRLVTDWDELVVDDTGMLARIGSPCRDVDYAQLDYARAAEENIALDGNVVDPSVSTAVAAYAMVSNYAVQKEHTFNPFKLKETAPDRLKSRFPQKLLDLNKPDDDVRAQLVEYLRE